MSPPIDTRSTDVSRRRLLLALIAAAFASAAAAQASGVKRLAIVSLAGEGTEKMFGPVLAALAERGYRRGVNLAVTMFVRDLANLSGPSNEDVARQAVASRPDAILTISTQSTLALHRQTRTIPIITSVGDPVAAGFAKSIARPGGNVTGISQGFSVGAVKGVEALRLLVPGLKRLAIFHSDVGASKLLAGEISTAAVEQGLEVRHFPVEDNPAARRAFGELAKAQVQAGCWLISGADASVGAEEAVRRRLPLVSIGNDMTEVGMLASFTTVLSGFEERLAAILARVLAGEDPAIIPFELPGVFAIAINRHTARSIGLEIPAGVLLRATRVVD